MNRFLLVFIVALAIGCSKTHAPSHGTGTNEPTETDLSGYWIESSGYGGCEYELRQDGLRMTGTGAYWGDVGTQKVPIQVTGFRDTGSVTLSILDTSTSMRETHQYTIARTPLGNQLYLEHWVPEVTNHFVAVFPGSYLKKLDSGTWTNTAKTGMK